MNFGFIIDNRKCIGCHACTVACKAEHEVPLGVNRTWVKYIEKGTFPNTRRLFSVMRCNHCDDAPCVEICPVTALFKRDDGIVDFDKRRCIGCKGCMQACPYDALYIDPDSNTAAKCNYCAHRVDIGLEPACVNVCPEHAIISGDLDNPVSEIAQLLAREQVTARKVEKGTRPKLFYIDGDEAALKPLATPQSDQYMWSSQITGVGHFAKYAEARMSQTDPAKLAQELAGSAKREEEMDDILIPRGGDEKKMYQKALEVIKENARRVYDAPNKGVLWDWKVSAYVWTKAVAAGAFLVPFLAHVLKVAEVSQAVQWFSLGTSLIFLFITTFLLVKDLDQPKRFLYVMLRPQWNSWLVRGGYALAFYGGTLTLLGASLLFGWRGMRSPLLWSNAILAVIAAVYTAFLFAQAKGRDFWQSPMLPLHMLVHAFMAGAAVFGIFALVAHGGENWSAYLRKFFCASLALNLFVLASELMTPHPTADAKAAAQMIISGRFSARFWLGPIILGNVLPLLLLWFDGATFLAVAGALVLAGVYITEHIWVGAPQLVPLS
jgi:Fe-S-cluster-containing dehydrogenase component/formate-dependent nitrite reductase membrane component NrfD